MAKSTYQLKKQRLDRLLGLLKADDHVTSQDLAQRLKVSHRTLMRDLDELRNSGVPIEADRGRGGGLRLHAQWGLGRLQLDYKESLDLILSLALMEKFRSPLLLTNLGSLRDKVFQSFPEEHRKNLQLIRKRVHITGESNSEIKGSAKAISPQVQNCLHQAFFEMKIAQISYQDEQDRVTERNIEAHYLLFSWPLWYVMAWDHLRGDIRSFRVDRIKKIQVGADHFRLNRQEKFTQLLQTFSKSL